MEFLRGWCQGEVFAADKVGKATKFWDSLCVLKAIDTPILNDNRNNLLALLKRTTASPQERAQLVIRLLAAVAEAKENEKRLGTSPQVVLTEGGTLENPGVVTMLEASYFDDNNVEVRKYLEPKPIPDTWVDLAVQEELARGSQQYGDTWKKAKELLRNEVTHRKSLEDLISDAFTHNRQREAIIAITRWAKRTQRVWRNQKNPLHNYRRH